MEQLHEAHCAFYNKAVCADGYKDVIHLRQGLHDALTFDSPRHVKEDEVKFNLCFIQHCLCVVKRIEQKLMCGLTIDEINERGGMNQNKFLAYLALMNSATDVWQDFDIDKSIVVDDWETAVPGLVDHIDGVSYEIRREMTETIIPHMDGCGIMLNETHIFHHCR